MGLLKLISLTSTSQSKIYNLQSIDKFPRRRFGDF